MPRASLQPTPPPDAVRLMRIPPATTPQPRTRAVPHNHAVDAPPPSSCPSQPCDPRLRLKTLPPITDGMHLRWNAMPNHQPVHVPKGPRKQLICKNSKGTPQRNLVSSRHGPPPRTQCLQQKRRETGTAYHRFRGNVAAPSTRSVVQASACASQARSAMFNH